MRTFEQTHPWIKFAIDLSEAPSRVWLLLGEAQSKCAHISNVPLLPATAQSLHLLYLAKGALATTAIEGNTLTEEEVARHLEGKLQLPPSKQYLVQEIDNIISACNQITSVLGASGLAPLTRAQIESFNRQVFVGLEVEPEVVPGKIREHSVTVARYLGAPAEDCRYLLDRLCEWLDGRDFDVPPEQSDNDVVYALVRAILAHLYLAWIHPFADGNGRTARLLEFQILVASGVPSPAAHLLSNHYNQTRSEYYRQLEASSRSGGDVLPFLEYAVRGFVDGLRAQLEVVRQQQWDMTWRDYVHDRFRNIATESKDRQRHLVLDLSNRAEPVPASEISRVSPRVAAEYARKTPKTLSRDLNTLVEMGLLERSPAGYRARRETILAFLPLKRRAEKAASQGA